MKTKNICVETTKPRKAWDVSVSMQVNYISYFNLVVKICVQFFVVRYVWHACVNIFNHQFYHTLLWMKDHLPCFELITLFTFYQMLRSCSMGPKMLRAPQVSEGTTNTTWKKNSFFVSVMTNLSNFICYNGKNKEIERMVRNTEGRNQFLFTFSTPYHVNTTFK